MWKAVERSPEDEEMSAPASRRRRMTSGEDDPAASWRGVTCPSRELADGHKKLTVNERMNE